MSSTKHTHARRSTTFTATRNAMPTATTTHDTTFTATRNPMPIPTTTDDATFTTTRQSMHTQPTTRDTTFTPKRNSMHTATTAHETTNRRFTTRRDNRDASLRASQVDSVAVDEIAWFFTSTDTDSASAEARALIESWLGTLEPADQQALALRYDPLPCPPSLEDEWHEGFALALSLASAARWRPVGLPCPAVERLASEQLEDAVRRHGPGVLRGIQRRADWAFATATRAYAKARGRAPSALPRRAA